MRTGGMAVRFVTTQPPCQPSRGSSTVSPLAVRRTQAITHRFYVFGFAVLPLPSFAFVLEFFVDR